MFILEFFNGEYACVGAIFMSLRKSGNVEGRYFFCGISPLRSLLWGESIVRNWVFVPFFRQWGVVEKRCGVYGV